MSTRNEMKKMIGRMRGKETFNEHRIVEQENDLSVRDMLKITRMLNEDESSDEDENVDVEAQSDQSNQEERIKNYFDSRNILAKFKFGDLMVTQNKVFWSFVINGELRVAFKVDRTGKKKPSMVFGYKDQANPEEYKELTDEVKKYFDIFIKWTESLP